MTKKVKLIKTHVKFKLEDKDIEFDIYHNLKVFGNINTLQAAIDCWFYRTRTYTASSLCRYINSKRIKGMSNYYAYTVSEYKFIKEQSL